MKEEASRNEEASWEGYYRRDTKRAPKEFLARAIEKMEKRDTAIDVGAGSCVDAEQIQVSGFNKVVVFDSNPRVASIVEEKNNPALVADIRDFSDYDYPPHSFDLVYASKALHYISREKLPNVLKKMQDSVTRGGMFVAAVLGDKTRFPEGGEDKYTFLSEEELKGYFSEDEWADVRTSTKELDELKSGKMFHYHMIGITAKKK